MLLPFIAFWRLQGALEPASTLALNHSSVAVFPPNLAYLLPQGFAEGNTASFADVDVKDHGLSANLSRAQAQPFWSFNDKEFIKVFGADPVLELIAEEDSSRFFEGAVWADDRNEVWFTSHCISDPSYVSVLDLETRKVRHAELDAKLANPNGGNYWNSHVYFATFGSPSIAPAIIEVEPSTGKTKTVTNSFLGRRLNGPDDLVWVQCPGHKPYLFFTDVSFAAVIPGRFLHSPQLPNAVWRYDPSDGTARPVITRNDIVVPNGIHVNRHHDTLYVTDTSGVPFAELLSAGVNSTGTPSIWKYDLDEDCMPVNKRLVSVSAVGFPDGLHIDDDDRVWTGEQEGIVVRDSKGKLIAIINARHLLPPDFPHAIAQVALAGDKLVILAHTRLWMIKLPQSIFTASRQHSR